MIRKQYEEAARFHGHACPGLAIGVRATAEALRLLEITERDDKDLVCVLESLACYADGIQVLTGCTLGKSNLKLRATGKTAFSFYRPSTGKSVRLVLKALPEGLDRPGKTEFILTAPLEEVFAVGAPRAGIPPDRERSPERVCPVCGESVREDFLREKDGVMVCPDCVEE